MVVGFNPQLILGLSLAGTFAFGLGGGLAGVRARLDLLGVVVLAFVVALAGGVIRDLMIGVPPATFRDGRYLAAAAGAGVVSFLACPLLDRVEPGFTIVDAIGLGVFCVAGASDALAHGLGPVQSVILGAITGVGGGIVRDVLLREIPSVLHQELYALPALLGAAVVVVGHQTGSRSAVYPALGAVVCIAVRLIGVRFRIGLPIARSERIKPPPPRG
ncbi:MAG: trimeric intracellular cation channel family protein [Solirubrobacteraceae bacterium]